MLSAKKCWPCGEPVRGCGWTTWRRISTSTSSTWTYCFGLPDLDPSFEKLYGCNDDVTGHRASVGLALEVCGASVSDRWARSRSGNAPPLIAGGLVSVEDSDRPLLAAHFGSLTEWWTISWAGTNPTRCWRHYLSRLGLAGPSQPRHRRALDGGVTLFYAQERPGSAGLSFLAGGLIGAGLDVVAIDLALLSRAEVQTGSLRSGRRGHL